MNVLLIGSGGREHALAWKIAQSPLLTKLYIAPGNPGTALCGTNVSIPPDNFPALAQFTRKENVQLIVVGPEDPLVKGIVDFFRDQEDLDWVTFVGPDSEGARLEGSKDFAKQFMQANGIPTAAYHTVWADRSMQPLTAASDHETIIRSMHPPYVVKADGLAAGKGVVILNDPDAAIREVGEMFAGKFGSAGEKVVIEEYLRGIELSVFILTDGKSYVLLPEAKDYKRVGEGDTGLNTGGMGAVSPVPFANKTFMDKVRIRIIEPTIKGLQASGIPYRGFVFFGLMNVGGDPFVIEYNVRMGDPEAEVVIPRIQSDLLELLIAAGEGTLGDKKLLIREEAAVTVMLVSGGYPGPYQKGKIIAGLDDAGNDIVFHSGTSVADGKLVTGGGRVVALTSLNRDWKQGLRKSYEAAGRVSFEGMYYRHDIGFDL